MSFKCWYNSGRIYKIYLSYTNFSYYRVSGKCIGIALVPAQLRNPGLKVSFVNADGVSETWEYGGGSWAVAGFTQVGAGKLSEIKKMQNELLADTYTGTYLQSNEIPSKKEENGYLLPDGSVIESGDFITKTYVISNNVVYSVNAQTGNRSVGVVLFKNEMVVDVLMTSSNTTYNGICFKNSYQADEIKVCGKTLFPPILYSTVPITSEVNNLKKEEENKPVDGDETSFSDFAISDEKGNDIVRFLNGHIRTKSFNSEDIANRIDNIENGIGTTKSKNILGLGASFMRGNGTENGTNNIWFFNACKESGNKPFNDALGGTNIMYHANRLFNGEILRNNLYPISEIDAVLIMHSHDKDVFTLDSTFDNYSVEDYETNNIVPFSKTSGTDEPDSTYAKAFDYVIKKIKKIYFDKKTEAEYESSVQGFMGQYIPKPCQIILCTHWHDGREKYNGSIRKLAEKWGLPLIEFDKNIGFTKSKKNPSTSKQPSLEFVGNIGGASAIETINGEQYGWHPMCGEDSYIQAKMARIASLKLKEIV